VKHFGQALLLFFLASTTSCFANGGRVEMSGFVARVEPILQASSSGGRVYYRGICKGSGISETFSFPSLSLRDPPGQEVGVEAVRLMLPPGTVIEKRPGIISVQLAPVPTQLLNTKIKSLKFTEREQFNGTLAMMAIMRNADVVAAMRRLGFGTPFEDMSVLLVAPRSDLPHLPESLSNVTVDQALDLEARTFGDIVFVGTCKKSHLVLVTTAGGFNWAK
jgi:hypothetical protein